MDNVSILQTEVPAHLSPVTSLSSEADLATLLDVWDAYSKSSAEAWRYALGFATNQMGNYWVVRGSEPSESFDLFGFLYPMLDPNLYSSPADLVSKVNRSLSRGITPITPSTLPQPPTQVSVEPLVKVESSGVQALNSMLHPVPSVQSSPVVPEPPTPSPTLPPVTPVQSVSSFENATGFLEESTDSCKLVNLSTQEVFTITDAIQVLGRSKIQANVSVSLDSSVSRSHCSARYIEGNLILTDLNSTYGTYLGSERLAPDTPTVIPPPAVITLGRVAFQLK